MNIMQHSRTQSGSVFIIILLAIAIFAGLSYALMQGSRTGTASLSDDQARLMAQEIITYGDSVAKAVQTLRLRGCTDTKISFENTLVAGYTNGTDTACQVFHTNGGKLIWQTPPENALDNTFASNPHYGNYIFTGNNCVTNVGTDNPTAGCAPPELMVFLPMIKKQVKDKINTILNHDNKKFEDPNSVEIATKFQGVYGAMGGFDDQPNLEVSNVTSAAVSITGGGGAATAPNGSHIYYQVLIAR